MATTFSATTDEVTFTDTDGEVVFTPAVSGPQGPAGQGVPAGGTTGQVLAKASGTSYDTTWVTGGGGSGDVVGPASSVDGRAAIFDGTTGKLITQAAAAPVLEGDARLTNARTPSAHAASHQDGGTDELALDGSQITTGTIGVARLATSGTATAANFLNGSGAWARPTAAWSRFAFADIDYDISSFAFSCLVVQTGTLTATRTVTLPSTGSFAAGQQVVVWSGAGVSTSNRLTIAAVSGQTINGAATFEITQPNRLVRIMSNRNATSATNPNWVVQTADVDASDITSGTLSSDRLDVELKALGSVTSAADALPYFTGSGTAATTTLTSAGRALIDDADAAAQRTTLGLASVASSGSASDLSAGTVATARLGTGTASASTFLRGDQTYAHVNPAPAFLTVSGNKDYGIPGWTGTAAPGAGLLSAGRLTFEPWWVWREVTIDRLAVEVTTAAAAGSLMRLGIYNCDTSWTPTSLVVDAGTIAVDPATVPAFQTVTVNVTLAPGRYMACWVTQGIPGCRQQAGTVPTWPSRIGTAAASGSAIYRNFMYLSGQSALVTGGLASTGTAPDTITAGTGFNTNYIITARFA